jgi:Zn finger protein HypA/HybF involved in hydrogenase expression
MVEIIEIDCPVCEKGKIKIVESHGYFTSRKGFVGRSVNVYHQGHTAVLNDCPKCHAKIREIKAKL